MISGTDTGGFLNHPPTGKPFRFFMMTFFVLKDRQIVYMRRAYDVTGLLLQLATDSVVPTDTNQLYSETLERVQHEQDLRTSAQVQRALLPKGQHMGAGCELAAASVPCRAIGGDFFDYFDVSAGTLGFVLGDVAGKGPPAALLAARLQGIMSAHAYAMESPADTVTRVNHVFARRPIDARFATVVYGVVSSDGCLTYSNAGHNPPLLLKESGPRQLETGGPIVGVFDHATFEEETLQLDPGDTLILFSDGVTEAANSDGEEFGDDKLMACVQANRGQSAAGLLERILAAVHEFSAGVPQRDDLTVLVLRFRGAQIDEHRKGT